AARHDLGGQDRLSPATPILCGTAKDHTQIGVATRDHPREHKLKLGAASKAQDNALVSVMVLGAGIVKVGPPLPMRIIRNLVHFEHSSGQLVAMSFLDLG